MAEQEDLSRDVIKSDTAKVSIPQLELHITTGSLGGLITTVEGLATSVQARLFIVNTFVICLVKQCVATGFLGRLITSVEDLALKK